MDAAGGHYWNESYFSDDPWATVHYKTQKHDSSKASNVKVLTGLTNYEVLNHVVIVHDSTGAKVACGVIIPPKLAVPAFTPYVGYEGNLEVSGGVYIYGTGVGDSAGEDLDWNLRGVDPRCSKGANSEYSNSCGIHIHEGISCLEDAGGHYWDKDAITDDPWANVGYRAVKWSSSLVYAWHAGRSVTTGLENSEVNGHTMIVHNYEGGRAACGILQPCIEVVTAFVRYAGYAGNLNVAGWVKVEAKGVTSTASQILSWDLQGVDPDCRTAPAPGANPNACGLHIHHGYDCSQIVGGHFHYTDPDPWTAIKYKTSAKGTTTAMEVEVVTGANNFDVLGNAFVIHDSTGGRIACGILNVAEE
jgi:hypothetical protein